MKRKKEIEEGFPRKKENINLQKILKLGSYYLMKSHRLKTKN
jgi:hypothetical protein